MSERMQDYRDRMEAKGLVQVRVWVDKQDEGFVKLIAKFCRDGRKKKAKVRITFGNDFGRHNHVFFNPEYLSRYHLIGGLLLKH